MENSSKAIILSGAIFIAILLISTGVVIYNMTREPREQTAKAYASTEIQSYNRKFENFLGNQRGGKIREMISEAIASNYDIEINYGGTMYSNENLSNLMSKISYNTIYTVEAGSYNEETGKLEAIIIK